MKNIKIHFSRNIEGKVFSKAIMWYDNVDFSHCAIEFRLSSLKKDVIYHSSFAGVNFSSKDLFLDHNEIMHTYEVEVTDEVYRKIMGELIDNCGKEYATMQNIGIVIVDVLSRVGKEIENPWKKGLNCSELVYDHIIKNIYSDDFGLSGNLIRPSQVKNILEGRLNENNR